MEYKKLEDIIEFNPTETLKKGTVSKKIPMDKLGVFSKYINSFDIEKYNGGMKFRNGDTLLARITPCLENGKTSKVTILDEEEVGFGSTEYIVMRSKKNISDEDFIFYLAISPKFREIAIKSMTGTSGRQRVQLDVVKNTEMLIEKNLTISTAESCTGGLVSATLINYPGISSVFIEGCVTYSNESKINRLGVNPNTLKIHGAVSEETAREMAEGIAKNFDTNVAISTTGIAGPDGGTIDKPVGLVYIGIYINGKTTVNKYILKGNREDIRLRATKKAINDLSLRLLEL